MERGRVDPGWSLRRARGGNGISAFAAIAADGVAGSIRANIAFGPSTIAIRGAVLVFDRAGVEGSLVDACQTVRHGLVILILGQLGPWWWGGLSLDDPFVRGIAGPG